ncbi:MAG: hypothetical protein ACEQSQ_06065 [Candidatus Paceibacteria bacterium]
MNKYKCIRSFSTYNKNFEYGNVIDEYEFNDLDIEDQSNFEEEEEEISIIPNVVDLGLSLLSTLDLGSSQSNDSQPNNSNFGGFEGGDFGGGGSSGDF